MRLVVDAGSDVLVDVCSCVVVVTAEAEADVEAPVEVVFVIVDKTTPDVIEEYFPGPPWIPLGPSSVGTSVVVLAVLDVTVVLALFVFEIVSESDVDGWAVTPRMVDISVAVAVPVVDTRPVTPRTVAISVGAMRMAVVVVDAVLLSGGPPCIPLGPGREGRSDVIEDCAEISVVKMDIAKIVVVKGLSMMCLKCLSCWWYKVCVTG